MLRAYKYRIYPTEDQKVFLAKTFGCCRFVYNWALNLKIEAYRQEKRSVAYKEVQDRPFGQVLCIHFSRYCYPGTEDFRTRARHSHRHRLGHQVACRMF